MTGTYNSKARKRQLRRSKSFRWSVAAVVLGALLLLGAGVASAAIVLHGRGVLTVPAYHEQGLQVSDVRLSQPLLPGGRADLQFSVRNPNAFSVRVARVSLIGALRKAKPAGCTSVVTGPVTKPAGYRLPASEQVLVVATAQVGVVVHNAFKLAVSARTGCGFTVEIDVQGTQQAPSASPSPSISHSPIPDPPPPVDMSSASVIEPTTQQTPPDVLPTNICNDPVDC